MSEPPIDREIQIMSDLAILTDELTMLGPPTAARVLSWLFSRYGIRMEVFESMIPARKPAQVVPPKPAQVEAPAPKRAPGRPAKEDKPIEQLRERGEAAADRIRGAQDDQRPLSSPPASLNGRQSHGAPYAAPADMVEVEPAECPICHTTVPESRLSGHMFEVHGKTLKEYEADRAAARGPSASCPICSAPIKSARGISPHMVQVHHITLKQYQSDPDAAARSAAIAAELIAGDQDVDPIESDLATFEG